MKKVFNVLGYIAAFPVLIVTWPAMLVYYILFVSEDGRMFRYTFIESLGIAFAGLILGAINTIAIVLTINRIMLH